MCPKEGKETKLCWFAVLSLPNVLVLPSDLKKVIAAVGDCSCEKWGKTVTLQTPNRVTSIGI